MKSAPMILFALLALSFPAVAEERLRPSDVLDQGMFSGDVGVDYIHLPWEQDFGTWKKKASANDVRGFFDMAAGLGNDIEVAVGAPYIFKSRGPADVSGAGDPWVAVKYALSNPRKSSFGLLAGLEVKIDGGQKGGTETTDVTPWITASYEIAAGTIPYFDYSYTMRNNNAPDTHTIVVGLHKEFSSVFIFDGGIMASFTGDATFGPYQTVSSERVLSAGATVYTQLGDGFYLAPSISVLRTSNVDVVSGPDSWTVPSSSGMALGIALIYFW